MTNKAIGLRPACIKTLSAVEANPTRSNQHEFNGVRQLKDMFGEAGFERQAKFSIRGEPITKVAGVTWYDARADHETRTEHRLYFQTNEVMSKAQEGDNILIGFDESGELQLILIPRGAPEHRETGNNWESV